MKPTKYPKRLDGALREARVRGERPSDVLTKVWAGTLDPKLKPIKIPESTFFKKWRAATDALSGGRGGAGGESATRRRLRELAQSVKGAGESVDDAESEGKPQPSQPDRVTVADHLSEAEAGDEAPEEEPSAEAEQAPEAEAATDETPSPEDASAESPEAEDSSATSKRDPELRVRVPESDRYKLAEAAEAAGESVATFVRRAIELRTGIIGLTDQGRKHVRGQVAHELKVAGLVASGVAEPSARAKVEDRERREAKTEEVIEARRKPLEHEQTIAGRRAMAKLDPASFDHLAPNHPIRVSIARERARHNFRGAKKRRRVAT